MLSTCDGVMAWNWNYFSSYIQNFPLAECTDLLCKQCYNVTDKNWYIHVVTIYTQTELKYRLVDKEKRNIQAYLLYVPIFQIPVHFIYKYI